MTKPTGKPRGRPSNASKAAAAAKAPASGLISTQARYDAAGGGRRFAGWKPTAAGPNSALNRIDALRSRGRDSTRNDWTGESAIQKWTTNLVGVGIQAREKTKNSKREALWSRWGVYCDADGMLDLYGQQTLGVREWFDGGEYFLRKRVRRSDSPLEVPLQIQMLEAEMLPRWDTDYAQFMPRGNKIRSGIELDRSGQRVAYWFFKEHPGDLSMAGYIVDPGSLVRVPASEIRHVFEVKRAGQLRGVPNGANVLARLRTILDYDDAVLERQKIANLFVAFIKRTLPEGLDPSIDPASGLPIEADEDGKPMIPMEPGMLQELHDGEEMQFSNPPEAGTVFSEYMRTQHMGVAAGQGLPYELFSGDILNISDRTLRIVIQEFRRFCEQRQWQVIIPMHCQTTRDWFVEIATLSGKLPLGQIDEAKDVLWVPHGWSYIHPVQDAEGKALEVKNGVRSRDSWITERGDDPEQVDAERKASIDREKALGIPVVETAEADAKKAAAATPAEDAQKADSQARERSMHQAQMGLINAQASALGREVAPPNFHVNVAAPVVTVAPTAVQVDNHIEPTPIQVAAPNVTIEPSVVTIENRVEPTPINNQVNVNPTPVTIENNVEAKAGDVSTVVVELPTRKTTTEITRVDGEIKTTVAVEKTVE